MISRRMLWTASMATCLLIAFGAVPAADSVAPASQPAPERLTAAVYVSVAQTDLASKAVHASVRKAVAEGVPSGPFEKIIVVDDATTSEAKRTARSKGANTFFQVAVGTPERITHKHSFRFRVGRRNRNITFDDARQSLRSKLNVEMSVLIGQKWQAARRLAITSAEAPPAEEERLKADESIAEAWVKGVKLTTCAAIERMLHEHFFRGVSLRAVELDPSKSAGGGEGDEDKPLGPSVQIELTNRSHARIVDATVSVEFFDEKLKIWRLPGTSSPRPGWGAPGRPRRGGRQNPRMPGPGMFGGAGKAESWEVPAIVNPGEKALSYAKTISEDLYMDMKDAKRKARFVLHATPMVWSLLPSRYLHPLKPTPTVAP